MNRGSVRPRLRFLPVFIFLMLTAVLYSQNGLGASRGDSAVADRYAQWAKNTIDQGLWSEALAGLERASDFAGLSSDISYLLALARSHEKEDRYSVLAALEMAITVNRWNMFGSEAARLMKAENLIALRLYQDALTELSVLSKSPREAVLSLKALLHIRPREFRAYMTETLDRFPRESGPVRIFFNYLYAEEKAGRTASREDLLLLDLIIRRLPALVLSDPELSWMASPFMRDMAEAQRYVMAYRAVHNPVLASLPAALKLRVISEELAVEELFASSEEELDFALVLEIWDLLLSEDAKRIFRRNLSGFTGVLTEDTDYDGIVDSFSRYFAGVPQEFSYDADQDGVFDLSVFFEAGIPCRALTLLPPEAGGNRQRAEVVWEQYPAVLETTVAGIRYIPRPVYLFYSPVRFENLMESGLVFPRRDPLSPPLTRRVLVSNALWVERPSQEFAGGMEIVELEQGIPVRAREYVGNLKVSETEFLRGRPQLQRLDLNLDGHVDTIRSFSRSYRQVDLEELWDFERNYIDIVTVDNWEIEW